MLHVILNRRGGGGWRLIATRDEKKLRPSVARVKRAYQRVYQACHDSLEMSPSRSGCRSAVARQATQRYDSILLVVVEPRQSRITIAHGDRPRS